MNKNEILDNLTFGEVKELAAMLSGLTQAKGQEEKPDKLADLVGKKVLIRDHMAGVFITTLTFVSGTEWRGGDNRKIHYWDKAGAIQGLAETGCDTANSRITVKTSMCSGSSLVEVLPVPENIYETLMAAPVWNPK